MARARVLAFLFLALTSAAISAQIFPEKRITLYVGFGPGGPTDLTFRALAEADSRHLGQRIMVENEPGAAATLGAAAVARAKPDGYTLARNTARSRAKGTRA